MYLVNHARRTQSIDAKIIKDITNLDLDDLLDYAMFLHSNNVSSDLYGKYIAQEIIKKDTKNYFLKPRDFLAPDVLP